MDSSNSVQQAVARRLNFEQKRLSQPKKQGMTGDQWQEVDCIIPESLTPGLQQYGNRLELASSFVHPISSLQELYVLPTRRSPLRRPARKPHLLLESLRQHWFPRHKSALLKLHRTINEWKLSNLLSLSLSLSLSLTHCFSLSSSSNFANGKKVLEGYSTFPGSHWRTKTQRHHHLRRYLPLQFQSCSKNIHANRKRFLGVVAKTIASKQE
jgi:hypothetical protein